MIPRPFYAPLSCVFFTALSVGLAAWASTRGQEWHVLQVGASVMAVIWGWLTLLATLVMFEQYREAKRPRIAVSGGTFSVSSGEPVKQATVRALRPVPSEKAPGDE